MTYSSTKHGQPSSSRSALILWTADYDVALDSAKEVFQRHFPSGSTHYLRWLQVRVQTSGGDIWADVTPQVFATKVMHSEVELKLCEEENADLDVSILPIGHNLETTDN
ncbi:hypothetical protein FRC12_012248 [Ceratobasidium sp. 428]|nr:hypothetical protein FRC12_012248 [Ceratobasidium sp. 428]